RKIEDRSVINESSLLSKLHLLFCMKGRLAHDPVSDLLYLKIPEKLVKSLSNFFGMGEISRIGAHIPVIYPNETISTAFPEIGEEFFFSINSLRCQRVVGEISDGETWYLT